MARHVRLNSPGGNYHLIFRCVGKQRLIFGLAERQKYIELLGRAAGKTDTVVLAYLCNVQSPPFGGSCW